MTYDARQIANWFVARAQRDGRTLSLMSLLKLTYISHGWHLEIYGSPLFENRIEAWKYGPVIPDVYRDFKPQGILASSLIQGFQTESLTPKDEHLLEQIYERYGSLEPFVLSDLTHISGGPWDIASKVGGYYAPIPDELIKQHYMMKRSES